MNNEHRIMFAGFILIAVLAAYGIFALIGVGSLINPSSPSIVTNTSSSGPELAFSVDSGAIHEFSSEEELREFLASHQSGFGGGLMLERAVASPAALNDVAGIAPQSGGGNKTDYSTTNVQVEGVDEADIIKTDGEYIYALVNQDIYIVKTTPAGEAKVVTQIAFKNRPQDLFLVDNHLIVYGNDYDFISRESLSFRRYNNYSFFKVFDVTNKEKPVQVRDLNFEGSPINARQIGDFVYFITQSHNFGVYPTEPVVPRVLSGTTELDLNGSVFYFDLPYNSVNMTSVAAINVVDTNEKISRDVYVLEYGQELYASQDNLYITYATYLDDFELEVEVMRNVIEPLLPAAEKQKVNTIVSAESYVLSEQEKRYKLQQIFTNYIYTLDETQQKALEDELLSKGKELYFSLQDELEKTIIHKIGINKGNMNYVGMGTVPGRAINQFAMDEHDGYFRIATTQSERWSRFLEESERPESRNHLFVLDQNLNRVGAVQNLAVGEQIYSVRFMQGRAYMVTFEQIDPLFVIDVSNPTNPAVLGELKIPGFSTYLHPYDETHLIGLGRDTKVDQNGNVRRQGLKLSLFDVSDVANPVEIDTELIGDERASSIAEYDHHAFLFSKEKELLVLPVSLGSQSVGLPEPFVSDNVTFEDIVTILPRTSLPNTEFRGAFVYRITQKGFEERGRISHKSETRDTLDYWRGYSYYDSTVRRSLYINNILYTFSHNFLKMNQIDTLDDIQELRLTTQKNEPDFEIIN